MISDAAPVEGSIGIIPRLDKSWMWRWCLIDKEGQTLATSAASFFRLEDVQNASRTAMQQFKRV
jgi:hypothetical protein